jgi:anaphase-promoting complex subunit 1
MASVASLGLHQPAGIQYAIEEGLLPPDAPSSSYTWEVSITQEEGREYEDELLVTDSCVLWSRGGFFRKSFRFHLEKESVTQALLAYFPASADNPKRSSQTVGPADETSADTPSSPKALSRALVVFLKTQAHIYFLSGASHVVHMPFEVESACAAPRGVIIQRKPRVDNTSVPLRLPKVPPNSFISSQPPPVSRQTQNRSVTEFSTEGLGNVKVLPLRLSLTLENMWQTPMETSDSHWPRLVCLTDPLLELGLVVTHPDRPAASRGGQTMGVSFLPPSEEILHIEAIKVPHPDEVDSSNVCIAVTVNRETSMYTIWRLAYLENEDPFLGRQKKRKPKQSRRRSSMAPALANGAATPVHPSMRESFGVPLPGKRTRKSVKVDDRDKTLDNALSSLDPDKGNDVTRRQSRRVSSLLARADLSASQDRSAFAEQSMHAGHGGRRPESHGSQRPRLSSGYRRPSSGGTFNPNHSINSLPEVPVDDLLEELRAGGDFEGFHNMGLDDHDFDGLVHEMLFTKIHTISMENTTMRYSLSGKPARTQAKVFMVVGPPTATDDQGRALLLVAIQDPVDKRLQLLTLHLVPRENRSRHKGGVGNQGDCGGFDIIPGDPRRVQSVVDSCKVSDGHETIMILSEDRRGGREFSLQSPWGKVTTITLPSLYLADPSTLEGYWNGNAGERTAGQQIPKVDVTATHIDAMLHSTSGGIVDLRDKQGRFHRIRIKLQPSSPFVRKTLDICRSVLPASYADKLLAGWWHVMQWLHSAKLGGSENPINDMEWSAAVILLLASFLALGHNSETSLRTFDNSMSKPSGSKWEAMEFRETPNSSACPPWMLDRAWQWLLDSEEVDAPNSADDETRPSHDFIPFHVGLAKRWMASAFGLSAFGFGGYLPTALNRIGSGRETAAWSIALALHLLVEEQKLNILSSEDISPSQTDLKAVLSQVSRWLGWQRYEALYALGGQADIPVTHDLGTFVLLISLCSGC